MIFSGNWKNQNKSELIGREIIFIINNILFFFNSTRIILDGSKDDHPELPEQSRSVFNYSMKGIVAAFSGIRKRDELVRNLDLFDTLTAFLILRMTWLIEFIRWEAPFVKK